MSAEVMPSNEDDSNIVALMDSYHDVEEDLSSTEKTNINLTDLSLNDDSYLNSAIGKDKVFNDFTLKKKRYGKI